MDIDNPPEAYFEAMRRLRPEPPDEETVARIVEIFRAWCRKQERLELESNPRGCRPPLRDPPWASNQVQDISRARPRLIILAPMRVVSIPSPVST